MNTTISLKGIRPSGDSIVIGLYSSICIDAVLKVNLSNALDGDETNAIDIPQIAERLAFMLKRCEKDSEIEEHPAIALELIAKSVLNSAMHTWQISEADITVHAALRSEYYGMKSTVDDVCVTLNSVSREELNYSERRVVPESLAHVAVRSGSVSVDDLEEGEIADYYRSLIEEDRKEKQRKEDEDAVAAAKAAVDIANSFADDYENNGDSQCSCGDESKSVNYGNELVKRETKSPLFRICPT
ncbi:dihydroneopterin aldolase, partial [Bifidobacteriaceae bacterium WP022]